MSFEGRGFIGPHNEVISNENGTLIFAWPKGDAGTVVWEKGAARPVFIEGGVAQAPKSTFKEFMEEIQEDALRQLFPDLAEKNQKAIDDTCSFLLAKEEGLTNTEWLRFRLTGQMPREEPSDE